MDKLKMKTNNIVDENIEYIAKRFPNCITEGKVDFDLLKQELSNALVEGKDERYRLDWSGKRQAILTANSPISKTLRPVVEDEKEPTGADSTGNPYLSSGSVGKDGTAGRFDSENLYIEGDNLDVLKLLSETYLNKIKMIYIDPPYNTGNDFVYNDDFAENVEGYLYSSNQKDEHGNRMTTNMQTSGRYHSDWLSMMYMRLKVAKDLLTEDGVIFISIDESEIENLLKIGGEIFGEQNNIGSFIWCNRTTPNDPNLFFAQTHEYIVMYAKDKRNVQFKGEAKDLSNYTNPDNDPQGPWIKDNPSAASGSERDRFAIVNPYTKEEYYPPSGRFWAFSQRRVFEWMESGKLVFPREEGKNFILKKYVSELRSDMNSINSIITGILTMHGTKEIKELFPDEGRVFKYPKPSKLIQFLLEQATTKESIILDFFSGSATTAHAVMQLNAEDNGNRKFIMVQLPEVTDEKSEAYKAGYKNICEIGKERIRRAGKKIHDDYIKGFKSILKDNLENFKQGKAISAFVDSKENIEAADSLRAELDFGFRVLKLDDSNMKDTYYNPDQYSQEMLFGLESSVKDDRSEEDLLFQIMLDKGVLLSSKIEKRTTTNGEQTYYIVGETGFDIIDLICCLDKKIDTDAIVEIAKLQPECCVFLDSGMENDATRTNVEQIFATYSSKTKVEVL